MQRVGRTLNTLDTAESTRDGVLSRAVLRRAWALAFPDGTDGTDAPSVDDLRAAVDGLDASVEAFRSSEEATGRSARSALADRFDIHRRFLKQAMRRKTVDHAKLQRETLDLVHDVINLERDFPR